MPAPNLNRFIMGGKFIKGIKYHKCRYWQGSHMTTEITGVIDLLFNYIKNKINLMDSITRLNIHKLVVIKLDAYIIAFYHVECLDGIIKTATMTFAITNS
jgi:hypothetical protein